MYVLSIDDVHIGGGGIAYSQHLIGQLYCQVERAVVTGNEVGIALQVAVVVDDARVVLQFH